MVGHKTTTGQLPGKKNLSDVNHKMMAGTPGGGKLMRTTRVVIYIVITKTLTVVNFGFYLLCNVRRLVRSEPIAIPTYPPKNKN